MMVAKNEQNKRYADRLRAKKEPMVKVEKVEVVALCEVCGKEFVKLRSDARYCSEKCRNDMQRKQIREWQSRYRERLRLAREEVKLKAKVEKKVEKKVTGQSVNYAERVAVKISEDKFARCDLCGKEYVKTKGHDGRCPVCRGVYASRRVYAEIGSGWGV
jgi:predicted nucleic acid-binding Zn ribbon protein